MQLCEFPLHEFQNLFLHSNPSIVMRRGTRARNDPMLRDALLSDAVQRVVEDDQPGAG